MIKVYRYGLLGPTQSASIVRELMSLAQRYRNTLVEIERGRRSAIRLALSQDAQFCEIRDNCLALDQQFAFAKDNAGQVSELRAAFGAQVELFKDKRRALLQSPEMKAEVVRINELENQLMKSARAHCGLGSKGPHKGAWGSYLVIEEAHDAMRKDVPLYDGPYANDPRYKFANGDGTIGVQIQKGVSDSEIFKDENRYVKIDPVDEKAWHKDVPRGERRRASRTVLRLRIESKGRDPVWATWPMTMHRPLPEGATIKTVRVYLRMRGPREEWFATITVNFSAAARPTNKDSAVAKNSAVAIDIGWRKFGEEIRVASWYGSDGASGEIRLSGRDLSGIHKADDLRSIREKNFNEAKTGLSRWLSSATDVPVWLKEATRALPWWRYTPNKLSTIAYRWAKSRFSGDDVGYEALEAWRYHDFHLWHWECSQRTKALRHRREVYRIFAARLRDIYGTCVFENFDLRSMSHRKTNAGRTGTADSDPVSSQRHSVSTSEFRLVVANAFNGIDMVPAANTTRMCSVCKTIETFNAAAKVTHTCKNGHEWDQDENAARNILDLWNSERSGDKNDPGASRDPKKNPNNPEKKWSKIRRRSATSFEIPYDSSESARDAVATDAE